MHEHLAEDPRQDLGRDRQDEPQQDRPAALGFRRVDVQVDRIGDVELPR